MPSVRGSRTVRGIPGEPPTRAVSDACAFAPRCNYVTDQCLQGVPPLVNEDGGHNVRCVCRAAVQREVRAAGLLQITTPPSAQPAPSAPQLAKPLLDVRDLTCHYRSRRQTVTAVRDVSFDVAAGETLGVVGLSGSGKSTMLRALAGLQKYDGQVWLHGARLDPSVGRRSREVRGAMQLVFQDPGSSLNPSHSVQDLISRPLTLFRPELDRQARQARLEELMESVRLPRVLLTRYPWELSGGQQQRVAIARAFATDPALLLCDEVTSALDVSVQARILELLRDLADRTSTSVVFVSHDLAVVRSIAHRAIVMLDGEVVERGDIDEIFANPSHHYTADLLAAVPEIEVPA